MLSLQAKIAATRCYEMNDTPIEKKRVDADLKPTPVQVHAQYVKDFSFENPHAPDTLRLNNTRSETDVNIVLDAVKIQDETNPDLYESALTLKVTSSREGETLFIAEIVYAALVTIKDVQPQFIKPILYVDVPQMLFPFARQMVSNAVSAGGFPPLLLNPVDFRGMYENSRASQNEAAA